MWVVVFPCFSRLSCILIFLLNSNHPTTPRPPSYSSGKEGGRRSRQAQQRVDKMRKVYGLDRSSEEGPNTGVRVHKETVKKEKDEDWEQEADDLYQWTQELSFEDIT